MSQLGKRSRSPSMTRTPSTALLGSLCDIPSIVAPDQDPAALQLQQSEVGAAAAAIVDPAAAAAGRAWRRRQRQAQAHRHTTGSSQNAGPCFWPPALGAVKGAVALGGGNQGFDAAVAVLEPAQFLKACGLCTRRLGPGKDTYMYRGDMAFCSTECRDLRIALDERVSSCSMASGATAATTAGAGSKATRTAA